MAFILSVIFNCELSYFDWLIFVLIWIHCCNNRILVLVCRWLDDWITINYTYNTRPLNFHRRRSTISATWILVMLLCIVDVLLKSISWGSIKLHWLCDNDITTFYHWIVISWRSAVPYWTRWCLMVCHFFWKSLRCSWSWWNVSWAIAALHRIIVSILNLKGAQHWSFVFVVVISSMVI